MFLKFSKFFKNFQNVLLILQILSIRPKVVFRKIITNLVIFWFTLMKLSLTSRTSDTIHITKKIKNVFFYLHNGRFLGRTRQASVDGPKLT